MASLLQQELAKQIAKAFKGKLLKGTLRREIASTVNEYGDPVTSQVQTFSVEGIRDTFDARYALFYGIPQTDVRIVLIMDLIKPKTTPQQDDKIFIRGKWHQVRKILEIDPANASITLQCFEIEAPT